MILRRPVRLSILAALPLLATAACGDEAREPRPVEARDPGAEAATRLRQSIETATFTPPAPAGDGQAAATGAGDRNAEGLAAALAGAGTAGGVSG